MKTPEQKRRRARQPGRRWQRRLVQRYRNNIASFLFTQCHETDWTFGVRFYPMLNAWCVERSLDYGVPVDCVAAVVSALSPSNPFKSNMTNAEGLIYAFTQGRTPDQVKVNTYGQNKRRAFKVLNLLDAGVVKTSQKTRAFIDNIANLESDEVTVDVHAYSVAHAFRFRVKDMPSIPAWKYKLIAKAYRQVAAWFGLRGVDIQSVTWIAWKRVHRVNYDPGMWLDQLRLPFNAVVNSGRQAMRQANRPAHAAQSLKTMRLMSRTLPPEERNNHASSHS